MSTDVSLPAVFMPSRGTNINIYNPRAHDYFHAMGEWSIVTGRNTSLYIAIVLPNHCVDVVMVGTNYVFVIVYPNFPLFYCGLNVYFHVVMSEINSYYDLSKN